MFVKSLLVSLGCIFCVVYNVNAYQKSTLNNPHNNLQLLTTKTSNQSLENKQLSRNIQQSSYMTLTPTRHTNVLGNPLYELRLYINGTLVAAYDTITGRKYTQNRNRNKAGTEAPLPDGIYRVAKSSIPGTIPEAGERFLPIEPLFQTSRSALGIHYDPSYEKRNGEDGTSGCIALKSRWELDQLLNYIRTYQPEYLEVNIQ